MDGYTHLDMSAPEGLKAELAAPRRKVTAMSPTATVLVAKGPESSTPPKTRMASPAKATFSVATTRRSAACSRASSR